MKSLKVLLLLASVSLTLWNCKSSEDVDPGPDLTSGTISFKWNTPEFTETNYYVVISDTAGTILNWGKLETNVKKEFPYPPGDSKLANVTFITHIKYNASLTSIRMRTFTGLPADNYSYEQLFGVSFVHDGQFKVTFNDVSKFVNITAYVKGPKMFMSQIVGEDTETLTWGLKSGNVNDLYVQMVKPGTIEYKYLYVPGVKGGETKTIGLADFNSFTTLPTQNLDYPAHQQMDYTYLFMTGVADGNYHIYSGQWIKDVTPTIGFPSIPNLFPSYQTILISENAAGETFHTTAYTDQPTTAFTVLDATLVKHDPFTTKRISAEVTGDADIIHVLGNFGDSNTGVDWDVFAPMSSKVKINLPTFPQELVTEIPGLTFTKDQTFDSFTIEELKMSYKEFHDFLMKGNFNSDLKFRQGKSYDAVPGNGRKSGDPQEILKRLGIKQPGVNKVK